MKNFVCSVCGYIHFGDDSPEQCPICFSAKDQFAEKPKAITMPADPANLTEADKKHIPDINITRQEDEAIVKIDIGEISHVMTAEHYITHVDVYLDNVVVMRAVFRPETPEASVALPLKLTKGSELKVVENCNVHGNWLEKGNL